ncbi:NAD-dependent succinate-semialdehyde dehydrogenase [Leucobacter manosquensis]|uniref:NAD-dependent succinate-semialdehyde dehydrogenase n=1 Tax=Leucobacter manosquensis TaxID=2810611 RepID=A0ABS5M5H8_9MICO|nr:NAD-dependent succinate-semialdehyde dehydrogenase [Leucobacter manosquensis]MBS3182452.1 NAD-dependent succinate-semialdehyde dehydrogenase [Leucobacter manosquensis]
MVYKVVNPYTGENGEALPVLSEAELEAGIELAHEAFSALNKLSIKQRSAMLLRAAELHEERRDQLAHIIVREVGKPLWQAIGEIRFVGSIYRYYGEEGAQYLADEVLESKRGRTAIVRSTPLGALLGIMPWNFPVYQIARFAAPNLLAGNTVLIKPASQCPESSAFIADILRDAGFPEGAYQNLYVESGRIDRVIADPRVRGVSLTGSETAGRSVGEVAGRHLKPVVLELGGSDPFIVLSVENMDNAVAAALNSRLHNSGQACNGAKRFIVIAELYEEFRSRFLAALEAAPLGDPLVEGVRVGPMSSAIAAAELEQQVGRAIEEGAKLVLGDGRADGAFFKTAVLEEVPVGSETSQAEFFGPVSQLYRVSSEDEAIELANDIPFGLGSYLFTIDRDQALRVANRLDTGMVYVNESLADSPELPFGGTKASGFGRELGRFAITEFVNKKLIHLPNESDWPLAR